MKSLIIHPKQNLNFKHIFILLMIPVILTGQEDFDSRRILPPPVQAFPYGDFGGQVVKQGETMLISTPIYNDGWGAVDYYRFKDGRPEHMQTILTGTGDFGENFGSCIALDGDVAVIGTSNARAMVYVYRFDGFNWVQEQILSAQDEIRFGSSVDVSGDRIIVGSAPYEGTEIGNKAYIFKYDGSQWVLEKVLYADGYPNVDYYFGYNALIDGNTVVVASPRDGGGDFPGAVHIYEFDGSEWQRVYSIYASLFETSDIGYSMALQDDLLLIGNINYNNYSGAIEVFRRTGQQWNYEEQIIPEEPTEWAGFGVNISIDNDMIAVSDGAEISTYSVYLYRYERNHWQEKYIFQEPDYRNFGRSVNLDEFVLMVGAPYADYKDNLHVGVVALYELIAQPANVTISNGTATNRVKINWSSSSDMTESYKVYRDGEEIATTLAGARSHNDYDAVSGKVYNYTVTAYCTKWGETIPKGNYGWRLPDGRIDGAVQTRYGAGVPQVELLVQPVSNNMASVLIFDEETDYTLVKNFTPFPDTALTASFWMKSSDTGHEGSVLSFCVEDNDNEFLFYNPQNIQIFLGNDVSAETGVSANDDQWHHIALTWRSMDGAVKLFKDGILVWHGNMAAGDTLSSAGYLVFGQDQDAPGGGFQPHQAYQGMLDDVRLWRSVRTPAELQSDMTSALTGTEKNLVAYWTFDDAERGPADIVPDLASGGGHHMARYGAEMVSDDSAPVAYRTYSDPYGDYSIKNLYYEESREFAVSPSKPRHGFDPGERRRTLDGNNPTMTAVNFTDTTSFTIAGRVVQRFGDAVCYVADAEIWLDNRFMGVKTDANGEFVISVEEAGQYKLKPKFHDHGFEPPEMVLDVRDDMFDLEFEDTETDTLSGYVRASCQTYIGQAGLRIYNPKNPFGAIDTTITTNLGSGYYQILLPSREYYTEIVTFKASDPLLIPRPDDVIEYFDVTPVDLTDSSVVQHFVFRKPPVIEVTGWPEIGCAPYDIPILEMDVVYPLIIEVYEEFAGERCLVDTGTVTIYDDVGTGNQDPVTLELEGGIALYDLTAGEPNILSGGAHPYQKMLQVEADVAGEKTTDETWVLVTGHRPREQTFATVSPDLPFMILRDPPGDASYCYVNKEAELKQTLAFDMKTSFGLNTWTQIKLGCKMNLGWIAETVVDVWGSFRNAMEMKIETINQYEYAIAIKSSQKFMTSDRSIITGEGGDVFMGAALNLIYALTDVIQYDADSCKVDKFVTVVVGSEGFATNFIYTENHIRNVLIPQLAQLRDIYIATGSDSAKIYENQIGVWQQTLALNQDLKKTAVKIENRSFSAGAKYEYVNEISLANSARIEFNMEINKTIAIEAGAEIAGSGISGGVEIRMGMGMGFAQAIDITQTNTTGYVFDDDDVGDFFSVDVKKDPVYGTPVFDLVAGRSSCPWETGSQPRDGVSMAIDSYVRNYVPANDAAAFILNLGNTSQSDETREYHLRLVHGSNPDGAIVKVSGVAMGNALSYYIPAGEQFTASMTVERGPLANDYENLQLMMYPPCEYEIWQSGGNLLIADTVTFSVHFESPESQISLLMPENNWVINQTNNDSLQILIGNYNLNNPYLQNIKFQYRRVGEGWTTYYYLARKDIQPEYITFFWDVSTLPDGNYELRAVNDCGMHGVNYSAVASGIIDRRALIVMNTPEPSDGILNLGEPISVTFSNDIDCGRINPGQSISLQNEDGSLIAIQLACYQNQLVIIPEEDISVYENKLLTATVRDIRGVSGNILRSPVIWTFRVSTNPVFWVVSNISKTVYQGHADQFERTLKNAGNQDESFTITKYPAWLEPEPMMGTIPTGGEQSVLFNISTQLNVGSYHDTVFVQTDKGEVFLLVDLSVLKKPPVWQVNSAAYAYNMNVTARVILPDGVSKDVFDMISAFVHNECRGCARISYNSSLDRHLAYLTVYSNQAQGESILFRVWDASTGKEYDLAEGNFTFQSDATLGSAANPVIIEPKSYAQAIDVADGWTWFSINVNPTRPAVENILQELTPSDGDLIKGQYGFSQYHQDVGWIGTLQSLEPGKSYRLFIRDQQHIRCVGNPVNLSKTKLTLNQGWTWFGFPSQDILEINYALREFPAYPGDRVKSQTEYAEYIGASGTWEGSLENLVPGMGYMIKAQDGGTIFFPTLEKETKPIRQEQFFYENFPDWKTDVAQYEYNMSLTGRVIFNESAMTDTAVILGAFEKDVCKGLAQVKYIPDLDAYFVFLMIYAADAAGDTIQFRVYDPAVGKIREVTGSVVFENDAIIGNMSDPLILEAEGIGDELVPYTYYLNQNYPNPFNPETVIEYGLPEAGQVRIDLFNTLGQKVAILVDERKDAGRYEVRFNAKDHLLANGIYFYQLRAGGFSTTRKMLVLK